MGRAGCHQAETKFPIFCKARTNMFALLGPFSAGMGPAATDISGVFMGLLVPSP
jgi:hypothetical protein